MNLFLKHQPEQGQIRKQESRNKKKQRSVNVSMYCSFSLNEGYFSMNENETEKNGSKGMDRRDFLQGLATVPVLGVFGAALAHDISIKKQAIAQPVKERPRNLDELNIALIGVGAQGQVLMDSMLKLPGLRFKAVCDIWETYNLKRAAGILKRYGHPVNRYTDYREMLAKETGLDAVVIATPDLWHAEHTVACLENGLHVYCEKEMSNTLEGAGKMVLAARKTDKLLQIGHQRRSNPRYLHCYNHLIQETRLLGRLTSVNGQWNRAVQPDLGWPEKPALFDITAIKRDFNFSFDSQDKIRAHLEYLYNM